MLGLGRADDDVGDVLDIDGPAVARGQQQEADVGNALQRLPRDDRNRLVVLAERAGEEGAVGVGELVGHLAERDAVEREALRIGLDADLARRAADDIGRADAVDLRQFVLQLLGDLLRARCPSIAPALSALADSVRTRIATSLMPRPTISGSGMPFGMSRDVGANFLMHPQDRGVLVGADQEARGDDDAVVLRLRIDVLDAVDGLDDVLERTGDEFDRLVRLVAVGGDDDVDHRHADLRLFLARQREDGERAGDQRRQQQERRQRRIDEGARQNAGKTELHGATNVSPSLRPARISTPLRSPSSRVSPG